MEVTQQFLNRLRHELNTELSDEWGESSEATAQRSDVLAALDRACLTTILNGSASTASAPPKPNKRPQAGSQAAKDRARKAAETRRTNKEKAGDGGQGGGQ